MPAFPRDERVRKRADFVRIQRAPMARVRSRSFVILVGRRDEGPTRLGVVASKKVGNAVVRNRAKRLLREVFRNNKPDVGSLDLIVIAAAGLPALSFDELTREWTKATADLRRRTLAERR